MPTGPESVASEARRTAYTEKRKRIASVKSYALGVIPYMAFGLRSNLQATVLTISSGRIIWARVLEFLAICLPVMLAFLLAEWLQHRLDTRYGISIQSARAFLKDATKRACLRFGFWFGTFCLIYLSYWLFGNRWWLVCGILFGLAWAAYLYLFPSVVLPQFFKMERIGDEVGRTIQSLCDRAGVHLEHICTLNLSQTSRRSNLAIAGFGNRRTLLITDTVLHDCSRPELEALVAHELGHVRYRHMEKRAVSVTLLSLISFCVANQFLMVTDISLRDLGSFAAVCIALMFPLFLGFLFVLRLWRRHEFAADDFAFRLIGDTSSFVSALSRLSEKNLVLVTRQNQHRFGHPATEERIRRARAFTQLVGCSVATANV